MEATRGAALSSAPTGNPIVPDRGARSSEPLARRSQHGGQPGTSALQRLGDWAKRPGTLAQRPTRAASRGARGGGEEGGAGAFLSEWFVECSSTDGALTRLDQKERLRHYSLEVSLIFSINPPTAKGQGQQHS